MVDYATVLRQAHTISKLIESLVLQTPLVNEFGPDVCPLRIRHYALSGALVGFPREGWECPYCGEFFTSTGAIRDDW